MILSYNDNDTLYSDTMETMILFLFLFCMCVCMLSTLVFAYSRLKTVWCRLKNLSAYRPASLFFLASFLHIFFIPSKLF